MLAGRRQPRCKRTVTTQAVRSTFYLEPGLHQAMRRKAATARRSMLEIVNDAVRALLREDEEDLAVFSCRAKEKTMSSSSSWQTGMLSESSESGVS